MAVDWASSGLRFALYLDLMILFGVAFFATCTLAPPDQSSWIGKRYSALAILAAVLGLILSLVGLVSMAMQMTGASDYSALTGHIFTMILTRSGAGIAWDARMAALVLCLLAVFARRQRAAGFNTLSIAGAVALASIAWAGHGAMDEGARGALHLAADVLHLIAAGAWIGALISFVLLYGTHSVPTLSRATAGFAGIGSMIVAALVVTGVINYVLTVGPTLRPLFTTLYGGLLATKLVLFAGMVGLAAANRYRFSPRLESALASGDSAQAVRVMRRSLTVEALLGISVVALVACLGVLSPEAQANTEHLEDLPTSTQGSP